MTLYLTESEINQILTMELALETVEQAFSLLSDGGATNGARSRIRLPAGGLFNFMCAAAPGAGVMGLKAYGVVPGNPVKFYVQLFSTDTGELLALMEAGDLGQVRTGAASGVATKYMAREDAASVGVIGSGYQARTQLEAVCKVRPITSARVFSRNPERRERFATRMGERLNIDITAVDSGEECVADADVVITMTSANRPVLNGEWLKPGTHINAAGANHWMRRELDGNAVRRSDVIVTDDIEQAKMECGDLIYPAELGSIRWEQVRSLADVVGGATSGRNTDDDITLFESQGLAVQDITTGIRVYQMALERGIGATMP
ncbi:MAG: ornithine cyclodeaminase family protein [Chloroflexota bacterium]|nr:ornithine cyclodeaminase family protein [Chloroflexota bacterium]